MYGNICIKATLEKNSLSYYLEQSTEAYFEYRHRKAKKGKRQDPLSKLHLKSFLDDKNMLSPTN